MCIDMLRESSQVIAVLGSDLQPLDLIQETKTSRPWPSLLENPLEVNPTRGLGFVVKKKGLTWRFRSGVTLILQDEMARVLDIRRGRFHALDLIGTRMLFKTLEAGSEAMVQTLAKEYQVSEVQVQQDWRALVEEFSRAGLTEAVPLNSLGTCLPGRWAVWIQITLAWASFRLLGWEWTLRLWKRRARPSHPPLEEVLESILAGVDQLVRHAASRHLLNPRCKERALVTWHVLRQLNLPARLVMAVSLYPFEAHAWAEVNGRVVGDDAERCKHFTPVAVYE